MSIRVVGTRGARGPIALAPTSNFDPYSKVSIIRPGRSRLLEFEKKIVLVV